MEEKVKELEMFVAGLVLDPSTNSPIVVLKDESGEICLPIWIGMPEATAIASAIKSISNERPMTHDLLKNCVEELGGRVVRVVITDLQDNTFVAQIEIVVGEAIYTLDSRPSDAIALAVRTSAQVFVLENVLEVAKVSLVEIDTDASEEFKYEEAEAAEESQNFASLDKEKWEQILSEMDPDDFKYKM